MRGARALITLALLPLGACVYYNAMWTAERFASQARRAEAAGQDGEARSLWLRAAVKAETVAVRHPRSRWADDAMILRAEALARAGGCSQAEPAVARARALLEPPHELRERLDLAAAECDLAAGRPAAALTLLEPILASGDTERQSRASYLAGRAAWSLGDGSRAAELLQRSHHPAAAGARARVLLASGHAAAGLALLDTLAPRRFVEAEWSDLLGSVAHAVSPTAASLALDSLLRRGRVPPDAGARLLTADGDRRAAAGELAAAGGRYAAAAALAPDQAAGDGARARRLRTLASEIDSLAEIDQLVDALGRLRAAGDQRAFTGLLEAIRRPTSDATAFRAAELARDSLRAPRLAARLFLQVPSRWPASIFAPKAIVAAIALQPQRRDSLLAELDRAYAASPYTLAVRGLPAPGFAAVEDSLARALGLTGTLVHASAPSGLAPWPGPRSVWLDPPAGAARGRTPPSVTPPRGPPLPAPSRPVQRPGERPVDPAA